MFHFLKDSNSDDLLAAVSYAIRALTHREVRATRLLDSHLEMTPSQIALGKKIVAEIESSEKQPVHELDSDQVKQYISDLYELVDKRWTEKKGSSVEAERVLEQFRHDGVFSLLDSTIPGKVSQRGKSSRHRRVG